MRKDNLWFVVENATGMTSECRSPTSLFSLMVAQPHWRCVLDGLQASWTMVRGHALRMGTAGGLTVRVNQAGS